ncbi:MAG: UDP-N-acetylmuramate dehydrogenase [Gammaproteobacteria bacterium]|nr:UDP-N-acetylmuramate dehydrogenase [Gammaproteobacteria bacterium]MCK5091208.1 UDP-N-acetylmuramate dehydrogenase [Gammaproteobacteria bacterium]
MAIDQQSELRGEMRYSEPMSRYTSWRVGGLASSLYRPADLEDLSVFLGRLPNDEPLFWLGLGSNLLVRDGGIPGTVIATQGMLDELDVMSSEAGVDSCDDKNKEYSEVVIRVEAGVSCAKVARFASRLSLIGVEFLAGIPGTMGGALAMNAGAFGGETWDHVIAVETIDRMGEVRTRKPQEFEVGYRSVKGADDEWFVAAHLRLIKGDAKLAQSRIKELLDERNNKQPIGLPSCGSVFRNPDNDHAAVLIEAVGMKGECIGGACVSDKHANFIINTGSATANDIEMLINKIMDTVEQERGVRLVPEVKIVGKKVAELEKGNT